MQIVIKKSVVILHANSRGQGQGYKVFYRNSHLAIFVGATGWLLIIFVCL